MKPVERKLGRPHGSSSVETRKRLLDASAYHFNANDFSGVSLAKISETAGVTAAAIYNHFGSKEGLFAATVKDRIESGMAAITKAAAVEGSWKDRLSSILSVIGQRTIGVGGFPLITSVAQTRMVREPEKYAEIIELRGEYSKVFQSIVADAIAAGDLPKSLDVPIAGELLMALTVNGIQTVSFYHSGPDDTDQIIEAVRALLGINR